MREFVEKLAALVPPPRKNLVSYHGVLGARSAWRSEVVPKAPETEPRGGLGVSSGPPRRGRLRWADLLYRVYEVDGGGVSTVRGADAAAWGDVAAAVDGCAAEPASECGAGSAGGVGDVG